ncbi:60S ribosomal protein L31 [Candidatus Woesearchaeota archaeon]|nr:60S ribosomal protein L31 [Candidatus Woesearchaeota archaeon]
MTKEEKLERKYVIPLRKEWRKVPMYKRSRKAINAIREFVMKHMKVRDVRIGKYLNLFVWEHGTKNPPHKVEVNCVRENAIGYVELLGYEIITEKPKKKEDKKKLTKEEKEDKKEQEIKREETKEAIENIPVSKAAKAGKVKFERKENAVKTKEEGVIGRTSKK